MTYSHQFSIDFIGDIGHSPSLLEEELYFPYATLPMTSWEVFALPPLKRLKISRHWRRWDVIETRARRWSKVLHAKLRSFENQRKYLGNVWIDLGSTPARMQSPLGSREGLKGWGLGSPSLKKGMLSLWCTGLGGVDPSHSSISSGSKTFMAADLEATMTGGTLSNQRFFRRYPCHKLPVF